MIIGAACEEYATKLVEGSFSSSNIKMMKCVAYRITADCYSSLRRRFPAGCLESQMLSGLVSSSIVSVIHNVDIHARIVGVPPSLPQEVVRLAADSDHRLFSTADLKASDLFVLSENGISVFRTEDEVVDLIYRILHRNRIIGYWCLKDGGVEIPQSILMDDVRTASSIKIYDRYFHQVSGVRMIKEILSSLYAQSGAPLDIGIEIYIEKSQNYSATTNALAALSHFIGSGGHIRCYKISSPIGSLQLHDRFMQINRSKTFVFLAGTDCFYDHSGVLRNRDTAIYKISTSPACERYEFQYLDGGTVNRGEILA